MAAGWSGGSWYPSELRSWQKTDQRCCAVDFFGHSACQGASLFLLRGTFGNVYKLRVSVRLYLCMHGQRRGRLDSGRTGRFGGI